jgi:UDP-N-acetyl-D-mannosaminuronate dehydrogenase
MIHLGNKQLSSRKILLLGFSYKPEVGDIRETPARELGLLLSKSGADVLVWDPFVEAGEIPSELRNCNDPYQEEGVDMILLATAHNEIVNLDWEKMKEVCNYPLIYDGRRVLDREYFESKGWKFGGVGVPIFD